MYSRHYHYIVKAIIVQLKINFKNAFIMEQFPQWVPEFGTSAESPGDTTEQTPELPHPRGRRTELSHNSSQPGVEEFPGAIISLPHLHSGSGGSQGPGRGRWQGLVRVRAVGVVPGSAHGHGGCRRTWRSSQGESYKTQVGVLSHGENSAFHSQRHMRTSQEWPHLLFT